MADDFWTQYAVQGATRPDSFSGMDDQFRSSLQRMFAEAPPEIARDLRVKSGYRSPERQAELWAGALKKYGSPAAARKWVAPPGNSQHNKGNASDLSYSSDAARKWAHANAGNYGLAFPLSNENWHIELAGARGKTHNVWPADPVAAPPTMADAQRHTFDPVQDVMNAAQFQAQQPARAQQPSALGQLYATEPAAAAPPEVTNAYGMQQSPNAVPDVTAARLPGLALMYMQKQAEQKKRRDEEIEADNMRRAALFGTISPYG